MYDDSRGDALADAFCEFVSDRRFPCAGAKAALSRGQIDFVFARDIASNWDDVRIADRLCTFARSYREQPTLFRSFVVIFEASQVFTEAEFERHLWTRIQSYSDKDSLFGDTVDSDISTDPEHERFGLSFGGEAFFVVGLHPGASRPARCFSRAALVFNAHEQFKMLRALDKYEPMRRTIIERDIQLAGSPNPMLARHGDMSEARQYSGRAVSEDWKCPFKRQDLGWEALTESA